MKTKDRILEVALTLFNREGMGQVGVREIARELGMSPGNLSYHFPRKEDLVLSLIQRFSAANDASWQAYLQGAPSIHRYLAAMERIFSNQYAHRGIILAQDELRAITQSMFDYETVTKRRREGFGQVFRDMEAAGLLLLNGEMRDFLVDFHAFFARLWILEAFYGAEYTGAGEDLIRRYLRMLATELSLFATEEGKKQIQMYFHAYDDQAT